jgi:hypothetical protein
MKLLTIATEAEGYFDLLKQSSKKWGYDLKVLGWQQKWQGFAWKLELYIAALLKLPPDEPVVCVDGYDVVVIAPPEELLMKFTSLDYPVIFSGQRYFPNHKRIQKIADQVMSNGATKAINWNNPNTKDYTRPCMGLVIGYAGKLLALFKALINIESRKSINDDQTLLNIYYLDNPNSIYLDYTCTLFQNLWRTKGVVYGKFSARHESAEIETYFDEIIGSMRVRNKTYLTSPCFLHAPFNLDIGMLLKEINLQAPKTSLSKDWHYLQYSIAHHTHRAFKLFLHKN